MTMSASVRRCVGCASIASLMPWMAGCHHQVAVSVNAPNALVGKTVHVKVANGTQASVLDFDGVRHEVSDVKEMEGVLMASAADSIRLNSVTLWLSDRSHAWRYGEAAIQVTTDVSATQTKLEPVRTTLVTVGVVGVVFAIALAVAIVSWFDGLSRAAQNPARP